jgi:DNA excision repair protein ERCC-2
MMAKTSRGHLCPKCNYGEGRLPARVQKEEPEPPMVEGEGLFPYRPREFQMEIVSSITDAFDRGKHIVIESGTGTGKTVCALVGSLEHSLREGRKLIYLTRTHSQARQVMLELKKISRRRKISGIALMGRRGTCLLLNDKDADSFESKEVKRFCDNRKAHTLKGEKGGCGYFANLGKVGDGPLLDYCRKMPTAEEFNEYCEGRSVCPYEAAKLVLPEMNVVVAPYVYLLSPQIRANLLSMMKVEAENLVLVLDEAHNVLESARELESFEISGREVDAAMKESDLHGDPYVHEEVTVRKLLKALREAMEPYAIAEEDVVLPDQYLEGKMEAAGVPKAALKSAGENLMAFGETVVERRMQKGEEPASAALRVGEALKDWASVGSRFVRFGGKSVEPYLKAFCVEPRKSLDIIHQCHAAVHMSGTLRPFEQYVETLDLREPVVKHFPSPFPAENRALFYVDDVTTKYESRSDAGNTRRMEAYIAGICNSVKRNTMVFFPSFQVMNRLLDTGFREAVEKRVYFEKRGGSQADLQRDIASFKKDASKGSVFLAVMGGRLAEGVDFPNEELQVAVIVGIPYAKPSPSSNAVRDLYIKKYGRDKGWQYAIEVPAIRKVQQAIGRLIRTENDVGAAVILDDRIGRYADVLSIVRSKDPASDVRDFFTSRR